MNGVSKCLQSLIILTTVLLKWENKGMLSVDTEQERLRPQGYQTLGSTDGK